MSFKIKAGAFVVTAVVISTVINMVRIQKMRKQHDEAERNSNAAAAKSMNEMRNQMDKDLQSFI